MNLLNNLHLFLYDVIIIYNLPFMTRLLQTLVRLDLL